MENTLSNARNHIQILTGLLHYHERMTLPLRSVDECRYASAFTDYYAEALREAIRCIEQVHGLNSQGHH